ncbi:MAG: hypothetical protein Q7J34_09100 [Bacteroidales bacterium]|nr:hypothetical protein [Bacteroidales bacterium]
MAHINHYTELETPEVKEAIRLLRNSGVVLHTQSPYSEILMMMQRSVQNVAKTGGFGYDSLLYVCC